MNNDAPSAAAVSADAFVAISALVADYGLAIDAGDFERFRRIWARDAQFDAEPDLGVVEVPLVGRDAIVAAFETMRAKPRDRRTRHYTMNLRLTPGERGTVHGLSALLAVAMLKSDGSQVVHRTGWYRDVFVRGRRRVAAATPAPAIRRGRSGTPNGRERGPAMNAVDFRLRNATAVLGAH